MPYAIFQLEQRLEPFVEWFHSLAATAVGRLAPPAAIELSASQAAAVRFVAWLNRLAARLVFRASLILWAQEAPIGTFSIRRVFDALGHVVAVITAVGSDVV